MRASRPAERVQAFILEQLENSRTREGAKLPPLRTISKTLNVSVPTVQGVLKKFQDQGMLRSRVGSGTFLTVSARPFPTKITIALSMPPPISGADEWNSPIYTGILRAATESPTPITILPLVSSGEDARHRKQRLLQNRELTDALLLNTAYGLPKDFSEEIRRSYEEEGKPVVCINAPSAGATANFVSPDFHGSSLLLGRAWRESHRRRIILLLAGPLESSVSAQLRLAGLACGLGLESEISLQVATVETTDRSNRRDALQRLLDERKPDAIYAVGDDLAREVALAAASSGRRIPRDLSIIGGSGFTSDEPEHARLTRTAQPLEEIGRHLVQMVCQRMQGGAMTSLPGVFLPTPFIGGGTTSGIENSFLGIGSGAKR